MYASNFRKKHVGIFGHLKCLPVILAMAGALIFGMFIPTALADEKEETTFEEASIFFELNDTDGDLGIHALVDGEPWMKLKIEDPKERRLLTIYASSRLRKQGLTEIFFESAEPSFDEMAPRKFFRRFPEGFYEIEGLTIERDKLESMVEITHVLPAPPDNVKVNDEDAAEDCDAELPAVSAEDPVIISWDPVETSHPEIGSYEPFIEIVGYQFVVEREEPELLVFSVDLPPSSERMSVEIPSAFIALGDEFKFEIVVREGSGNQTAIESCFEVE